MTHSVWPLLLLYLFLVKAAYSAGEPRLGTSQLEVTLAAAVHADTAYRQGAGDWSGTRQ